MLITSVFTVASFSMVSIPSTQSAYSDSHESSALGLIQELRNTLNNMDISRSLKTSLQGPLTNIEKILTDRDPANDVDACNKLNDFISSVDDKTESGRLTSAQGAELISQAEAVLDALGCNGGGEPGDEDNDSDGYTVAEGDCNDDDANVNPGETEIANEIDDNCNGQIDEGTGGTEFTPDSFERNNDFSTRADLGEIPDTGEPKSFEANFHSESDTSDWYQILATEESDVLETEFLTTFQLTNIPSGSDYDLSIYDAEGSLISQSLVGGNSNEIITVPWAASIGLDEKIFVIEVTNFLGTASSQSYTLTVIHK